MPQYFRLLAASFICIPLFPQFAAGQTRFEWSVTGANVSHYTTVEECLAAVQRIRDSVVRQQAVWRDTIPWVNREAVEPPDPVVVDAARRCAQQFSSDRTYRDWNFYAQLFLWANRDQDVETLANTHLASLKHDDSATLRRMQRGVKDTLLDAYLTAIPMRMSRAWPIIEEFLADSGTNVWARGGVLNAVFNYARAIDDTARAQWAAEQIDHLAATLSETDKQQTKKIRAFRTYHYRAVEYLTRRAQLDSIRRGTSAYIALKRKNWTQSDGPRANEKFLIGQHAPALSGDFWFPEAAAQNTIEPNVRGTGPQLTIAQSATSQTTAFVRPVPGQLNLLVFLSRLCLERTPLKPYELGVHCWDTYAALRRLATRYPNLKITIVSKTSGHLWPVVTPDPALEAGLLHQWWTEFHRLPAALVVTMTDFWRLPDPDRRRMDERTKYEEEYGDLLTGVKEKFAVLVDQNGIIVDAQELGRRSEAELNELLDILSKRQ